MGARYILRLDDACPTMNRKKWDRIELVLDKYGLKPIVAVIPDNKDKDLFFDESDPNFWAKVKAWQTKGWAIAMHGLQHLFVTNEGGLDSRNKKSEFAGLPLEEQVEKISKGWNIFLEKGIKPRLWVAPMNTFDHTTLLALETETDIRIISYGIALSPFYENNFYWIPKQLWGFKKFPFGLWTICLHPNNMSDEQINSLEGTIQLHKSFFISFNENLLVNRKQNLLDTLFRKFFLWKYYRHRLHTAILE